ncbi:MAG: DUF975 family protein [Lachnospiraceae bacterium]
MWNRIDLKYAAKEHMRKNYWVCVAVGFIYVIIQSLVSGSGSASGRGSVDDIDNITKNTEINEFVDYAANYLREHPLIILGIFGVGVVGIVISLIVKLFIGYQIEVGVKGFFVKNTYTEPKVGEILSTYHNGSIGSVALTQFLVELFIVLWSLLLVIPGIIKSYQYKMIPYILAENPDIEWREAFALSKQMTDGHKMDLFILDLSFLGWRFLSLITCGILSIFYVTPYYEQTMAEAYELLR